MKRIIFVFLIWAAPVWAVQPDEILANPALEARAREISKGVRCVVCRNENIDDSNADLARDLRLMVRERLLAGDSDAQVVDFLVARYGEYILLNPIFGGSNWILWAAGPFMLLVAGGAGIVYLRRRSVALAPDEAELSVDEAARLKEIMED